MKRISLALVVVVGFIGFGAQARADEAGVTAVLDKAIKALGGEAKLAKAEAYSRKAKGTITLQGNENEITSETTIQGLDHYRNEFEGEFMGNKVRGVVVLNGDKGWRKIGDNKTELNADAAANEKRNVYLQAVPVCVVLLKGQGFKTETADDEKVADKPAAVLKVTGPDGKDFTLFFDKESGLPVKLTATVAGFQGQQFSQETTFSNYRDFGGIQRATKVESKRNGENFLKQEITEFKVLDKVDPKTFAEPD
jgi:outer membrane lipoprotein-sorting protein